MQFSNLTVDHFFFAEISLHLYFRSIVNQLAISLIIFVATSTILILYAVFYSVF